MTQPVQAANEAADLDDILLRSRRFRTEREADWTTLETLLKRVEAGALRKLSDEDLLLLPRVYQSTLSSLAVARATSLDSALIDYLENLCTRAYFYIYGARTRLSERLSSFFRRDWKIAVASLWRETLLSGGLMFLGALIAYLLVASDPDWYYSFVPEGLAGGRTPAADTADLRETLYDDGGRDGLSVFATYLFTHNSQVAIFAFALGFALCLPSALLMMYQGTVLGAFMALYASRGLGFELGGWLLIHGVTELFAITLAGAAGLKIGAALVFAGHKTRLQSAADAGRTAAQVVAGVVVMLMIAGLLEGFGRQLITSDWMRYGVALFSGLAWTAYFYGGERRSA